MENTRENKQKLVAQYWGQEVAMVHYPHEGVHKEVVKSENITNTEHLLLRKMSQMTDSELKMIGRICHQLPDTAYISIRRSETDRGIIHLEYNKDDIKNKLHVGLNTFEGIATVNCNSFFEKLEGDDFKFPMSRHKVNIGEVQTSSVRPIPYIRLVDYFRGIGLALAFNGVSIKEQVRRGWVVLQKDEEEVERF